MGKKRQRPHDVAAIDLRLLDTIPLGVKSASAITALAPGVAVVVDDDEGLFLVGRELTPRLLRGRKDAKQLGDLESICASEDRKTVYAVSEEKGRVFAFDVIGEGKHVELSEPRVLGDVPRPGTKKNKGWEGASYLPASRAAKRPPSLVLVHERAPKAVGVFTVDRLEMLAFVKLKGELGRALDDVADVAVCPTTRHLFLLSDQSQRIAEARWTGEGLELLGTFDLDLEKGEKPEGLTFESPDRVVVVTDASNVLLRYALVR